MTDLDCLVINSELAKPESERQKIMLLQNFVVDLDNMVAYFHGSKQAKIDFHVQLTDQNNRDRSRISQRKTDAKELVIDNKDYDGFAKEMNAYGFLWEEVHNGFDRENNGKLKLPSPN